MNDHLLISYKITTDKRVVEHIRSIIWYGSSSKGVDVHERSDCDLQIVLDKPNLAVTEQLGMILEEFPHVDLSIIYEDDIVNEKGFVDFQSGSKGPFFAHVLAQGKVLYGENVYAPIIDGIDPDASRQSLIYTAREYVSRLRIMATNTPSDTMKFKKYSLKFMQDILVLAGVLDISQMSEVSYEETIKLMQSFGLSSKARRLMKRLPDFKDNFTKKEMAFLLHEYEKLLRQVRFDA
jgi:hypothetical protein